MRLVFRNCVEETVLVIGQDVILSCV